MHHNPELDKQNKQSIIQSKSSIRSNKSKVGATSLIGDDYFCDIVHSLCWSHHLYLVSIVELNILNLLITRFL